ncbi:outer membrane protein assembly factor BamD [Solimicrobium silvestre]|nr:outer membrane protein assembly factor BamD [Solimicrobium silvestre]
MQKNSLKRLRSVTVLIFITVFGLSACGLLPEKSDETKTWSAARLYQEAKSDLANGSYESAIKNLEKLESRFPFGTYAQQAQMEIPYVYYKQGDQAQALASIERFIKLHPNHENLDYIYYLRGLVNFNDQVSFFQALAKQDMTERDPKAAREAFDAFKALVTRFPGSKYTPDALLRMKYLVNTMAQYDLHVAKYYFRRGAYLASANRAQSAIKEYPDAPAIEEALYVLYNSYDKMGLIELRDDANRVFTTNFPNSKFTHASKEEKSWWQFW